ncbi:hypothetical protein Lal_00008244 [Lupinus albus]|nr:hypothetical protein Lal_00008244 [Lupinus albus]
MEQEDNKEKKALARTFFTKSDMNGNAWSMSSLRTALPYFPTSHSHSHSSQYPNEFSVESVDSKRNEGAEEDLRMSAVLNSFGMVHEDELNNITLPSVREESPVFQGHTRLSCIYEGSRYGSNERKILIRRAKGGDELLDELRRNKQEAKIDARRKRKHVQLMQRMKRKETAINDWQLHQTRKAMDELDKVQTKLERKLLMASARTQKKICLVREKAEKQKMNLRQSTMKRF